MAESLGTRFIRRQLGRSLRAAREARNLSLDDIDKTPGLPSKAKLSRIENGRTSVSMGDVLALCRHYQVDERKTNDLADLAPGTAREDWWETYGDLVVPDWFGLYVSLEAAASVIQTYHPDLVPGPFQTAAYARAILAADKRLSADVVDRRVDFRAKRQQALFSRQPPPRIQAILGAGALALRVGSDEVMTDQVRHLKALASNGQAQIRVLPWKAGAYPMRGSFSLLDFADPDDPPLAYAELAMAARYHERPEQVEEYRYVWEVMEAMSVPVEEYTND